MKILFFVLGIVTGIIFGVVAFHIYDLHKPRLVPTFNIKKEYATTKVTSKITEAERVKFGTKESEWWMNGWQAKVYLSPRDWLDNEIPQKMAMVFSGIPSDWAVQVDDQKPGSKQYGPAHVYEYNKPTNEFMLELDKPDATYEFTVSLYPKNKEADPNFYPNRDVRVHFIWKVQRVENINK